MSRITHILARAGAHTPTKRVVQSVCLLVVVGLLYWVSDVVPTLLKHWPLTLILLGIMAFRLWSTHTAQARVERRLGLLILSLVDQNEGELGHHSLMGALSHEDPACVNASLATLEKQGRLASGKGSRGQRVWRECINDF